MGDQTTSDPGTGFISELWHALCDAEAPSSPSEQRTIFQTFVEDICRQPVPKDALEAFHILLEAAGVTGGEETETASCPNPPVWDPASESCSRKYNNAYIKG
jgi:hypothetical protein